MRTYKEFFNAIANDLLKQTGEKPNYSNKDFMNVIIIFNTALMDSLIFSWYWDNIENEGKAINYYSYIKGLRIKDIKDGI